jgi:hypothetical protein
MRMISISTSVFARIWACRQAGEESENEILDRIIPGESDELEPEGSPVGSPSNSGHTERRYGVHFPGGFGISRVYLGQKYDANAVSAGWILANDGQTYSTLNELSKAIGAKVENAWMNWFYVDGEQRKPVAALRDPAKVARRERRPIDTDKLLSELEELPTAAKA